MLVMASFPGESRPQDNIFQEYGSGRGNWVNVQCLSR